MYCLKLGLNRKSVFKALLNSTEAKIGELLYPRHMKYVEEYIVFVIPSVRPFVRPSVIPSMHPSIQVLTFYVKVLHESFCFFLYF